MRCWSTIPTRRCAAIAPHCSRSCVRCLPASPSCRACRAEHRLLALFGADRPGRAAPDHRLGGVHRILHAVDLLLWHLLFLRLPAAAVPPTLSARARVGAGDPRGAALDLPTQLPGRGCRAAAEW